MGAFDMINLVQMAQQQGQKIGTPGINPAAPDPRPTAPMNKFDQFLGTPGGGFLMNLLAQSGYSPVPQSPFGAIGRAALLSQQQGQQRKQSDLQEQLVRSQVGLNQAKTVGALMPGGSDTPLTELGKINADIQARRITPEQGQTRINEIMNRAVQERFANTQKLRGEFSSDTKDIAKSLQSLSAAQSLIQAGDNPNAVAQLAAFISTIKSIDNSTVREGELRAFESVQGFVRSLENQISRAKGEGFTLDLRRDIADTIQRLQAPLSELLNKKRQFFSEEAQRFNLDPVSITGSPFAEIAGSIAVDDTEALTPTNSIPPPEQDDEVEDFT